MSALATTLQAFFTDRLIRQRQVSPNTVQSYRDTLRLLLVFASERHGKAPGKLDIDDLDAPLIGAFLDHLEQRQEEQRAHPQRAACRDPLPVPLCGPSPSRTCRHHRARSRHSAEALRAAARDLPDRGGDRGPAGCAGPGDLDRAARHDAVRPRRPDGPSGLRTDRAELRRCPSRIRRACQLQRQGAKAADHAAHLGHRRRPAGLAGRARRSACGPAVPDTDRTRPQPRRARTPAGQDMSWTRPPIVRPWRESG